MPLLNAAKVMSFSQVELANDVRSRTEREIAPQGLKRACENRKRNTRSLRTDKTPDIPDSSTPQIG